MGLARNFRWKKRCNPIRRLAEALNLDSIPYRFRTSAIIAHWHQNKKSTPTKRRQVSDALVYDFCV